MLGSWLKFFYSKAKIEKNLDLIHVVLGNSLTSPLAQTQDEILFGCGCFWGAEKGFWRLPGVVSTAVGYAGGKDPKPTYQKVCSGTTGHAEVVKVVWDKSIIDLSDLLKLFWECHDPTQGDRQGNDRGSQYRSAIYPSNKEQLEKVNSSLNYYQEQLSLNDKGTITTEIKPTQTFYFAENYHQQYLAKPGSRPYCSAMPTKVKLGIFEGSEYKLPESIWQEFNWNEKHCILRGSNHQLKI